MTGPLRLTVNIISHISPPAGGRAPATADAGRTCSTCGALLRSRTGNAVPMFTMYSRGLTLSTGLPIHVLSFPKY